MELASPFIPYSATLATVRELTPDVKLFGVEFDDPAVRDSFEYRPGQFAFLSAYGVGEAPFGIVSLACRKACVEFAVRKVGTVTASMHEMEPGAKLGLRGPFGNYFPMDNYKGKNIFIIGGGIGMAPLRPVINFVLEHRSDYGSLLVVNGARSPADLVFADEFDTWASSPNTTLELTVDRGDDKWSGRVALLPDVVRQIKPSTDNTIAIICGPPIMIRFMLIALRDLNFSNEQIVTTLEQKMKCGIGKCARCNVGDKYICQDGPVFTLREISTFLEQY